MNGRVKATVKAESECEDEGVCERERFNIILHTHIAYITQAITKTTQPLNTFIRHVPTSFSLVILSTNSCRLSFISLVTSIHWVVVGSPVQYAGGRYSP